MQKVLVFQRNRMGAGKVAAIADHASDIELRVVDVACPPTPIIDEPDACFPPDTDQLIAWADLVLDHLYHPDLTAALIAKAKPAGKEVIASGRKIPEGALTPTTCCTLGRLERLGPYGRQFGAPEFEVDLTDDDRIAAVRILRGAPCGATWQAAQSVVGMPADEAIPRMGLSTQFHCFAKANPNVFLTNPLHVAGDVHAAAFQKAVHAARGRKA